MLKIEDGKYLLSTYNWSSTKVHLLHTWMIKHIISFIPFSKLGNYDYSQVKDKTKGFKNIAFPTRRARV